MRKIEPHTLLSVLWLFVLLNIIFRDIHQFMKQSHVEAILTGYVDGMEITEGLMLIGGVLALIPISMVLLSLLLERKVLIPITSLAVLITGGTLLSAVPGDMDDTLHLVFELIALAAIVTIAWKLPKDHGRARKANQKTSPFWT